ncbi:site-specific recombinase XerD [Paenibacillus sp. V4I9]|uniref:tyrosine-type recombinase/integrase n=1 Tax=Paenibacillus sp. V4I9 TaxID=3042308 RepID=UPI002780ED69|nr:tyrosine-type recombinase/integrase [Paenibacillus sp. V4I9]MDQ0885007.1 site-specific recombinase XerD [Paenibacillus sp. V4I9]
MAIEVYSNYDYKEICNELGISYQDLLSLINNSSKKDLKDNFPEVSLLQAIALFRDYLDNQYELQKKSKTTLNYYFSFLNRFENFIQDRHPNLTIATINENILHELFSKFRGRENSALSPRTQNTYTSILRKFLDFCYRMDYVEKDYRYRFTWSKTSLLPKYFQEEQIVEILALAKQKTYGYRYHAMICFLLGTGCRVEELQHVRVQDFDIENDLIFIRKAKGNKERYIPMYPELKKVILDYLNLTHVKVWSRNHTGFLFCKEEVAWSNRGIPLAKSSIQYAVSSILDKLGYTKFSAHSFRHTFAVRCLLAGMKLHDLSLILGHEDPKTTFIYTQMLPLDLKKAVADKFPFAFEKLIKQILEFDDENVDVSKRN